MLEYDEMSSKPPAWYPAIEELLKHDDHEGATREVNAVLSRCRKAGKDADTIQALRAVAMLQLYDKDEEKPLPEGVAAAEEALVLCRKTKDVSGEAAALHLQSKFHMGPLGDPDEALREAGDSLDKYRGLKDKCGEAYLMNTVARLQHIKGNVNEAMRLTNDCIAIFEELDDVRGRISALQTLFRLHIHGGDRWQTIIVMDELVELHRRLGDAVGEGTAIVLAAQYEMDIGNPQGALPRAEQGAALFKREGLDRKRGSALLCAAAASVAVGDVETGRATAKEAADVLRKIDDLGGQGAASCILANAHRTQCEFRKAANRFEEAAMFYGQEGDKMAKANSMREVASCLVKMLANEPEIPEDGWPPENLQEPLRAAKTSASLFQQMRDTESEAYGFTLQQLSNCHLINKEANECIRAGQDSLRIFERTSNHQGAASAHGSLSQGFALKDDNVEALRLAKEGQKLAKRCGDEEHIVFHQRLMDTYGPLVVKEQNASEKTGAKPGSGARGEFASDNAAYLNGMPVVNYDTFQPRVATAPPKEKSKEEEGPGRAPKKEKNNVVYQARWVKAPNARRELTPEAPASRRVQKDVRSMGPHGGREVLPVGEIPEGFDSGDFEPDDAESWRRPSPMDGYQQRILASSGEPL